MSDSDRDAWVKRVLGVEPGRTSAAEVGELRERLAGLGPSLMDLRSAGGPEFPALIGTLRALTANLTAPDAAAQVDALEASVIAALRAARAAEAGGAARRSIDSAKLLLRWREAQAAVASNIVRLGQAVLARDDVKRDPRLPQVQAAVAQLPGLVPAFGPELERLLDRAMNEGSTAAIAPEALVLIADYRKKVAAAATLLAFERLAASELGGDTAMISKLDGTLGELEQELKAAA